MTLALSSALYCDMATMATSNIVAMLGAAQYCSAELREYVFTEVVATLTLLASLTLLPGRLHTGKAAYEKPVRQTRLTLLCPCCMCSAFVACVLHSMRCWCTSMRLHGFKESALQAADNPHTLLTLLTVRAGSSASMSRLVTGPCSLPAWAEDEDDAACVKCCSCCGRLQGSPAAVVSSQCLSSSLQQAQSSR